MKTKTKTQRLKLMADHMPPPINSRAEAEAAINDIAIITLRKTRLVADMDQQLAAIRARFSPLIEITDSHLQAKTEALRDWGLAHPDEFGKRKSIVFGLGTIGFRTGQPKLGLLNRSWNWKKALAAVQQWLPNFIRDQPVIDAEALINKRADPDMPKALAQCGLKIDQDESFYVDPNLTEIEKRQLTNAQAA